jgi:hypothetical protein
MKVLRRSILGPRPIYTPAVAALRRLPTTGSKEGVHIDEGRFARLQTRHFLAECSLVFYICSHEDERHPKAQSQSFVDRPRSPRRVIGDTESHADGKS